MNHYLIITFILISLSFGLTAKSPRSGNPVTTVKSVDLDRYLGRWYQQAFFPTRFQKADCGKVVTAEYSLDKKGRIRVLNTCWADEAATVVKNKAKASAYAVDKSNSKLKVTFFWPFKGDYWIVKLDQKDYSYSVVSDPKREYLWILSRDKVFDRATYQEILDWLDQNGWDIDRLVFTGKLK